MTCHPITRIVLVVCAAVAVVALPLPWGFALLTAAAAVVLVPPPKTPTKLTGPFLKLLALAAVFLFAIHAVVWRPPGIDPAGAAAAAQSFLRIAAVVIGIIALVRRITAEEFYALLIDLLVPPALILVLFRTLWLVPRFVGRIDEVVLAQRMRGMRIDSTATRFGAVIPTLAPIVASMLEETYEQAMTMTVRGFLVPGRKTHVEPLAFRRRDGVAIAAGIAAAACTVAGVVLR